MEGDGDDDLFRLVSSQHHELAAASAAESDLDFAFRLQLQEAIAASISSSPSSSAAPNPQPLPPLDPNIESDPDPPVHLQTLELQRFIQEHHDASRCRAEMARLAEELRIRAHDGKFARELLDVPDDEWESIGDNIEKPVVVGEDSGLDEEPFNLYFKGLHCEEVPDLAAVGIAVCGPQGEVVLKIQRPLVGPRLGRKVLDAKALVEGLQAAETLGIRRLNVYVDAVPLYNHVKRKWPMKQRNIATIVEQVWALQNKFETCNVFVLPRSQIQFVIKLAKDAIDSQITKDIDRNGKGQLKETCTICLEDTDCSNMFSVDKCEHRFCFSCMKQHVEVKLLVGVLPGCPHEGCKTKLNVESSKKFLPHKLSALMAERLKEASIPEIERVYCPYPKCSALMRRGDAELLDFGSSSSQSAGARRCTNCRCLFCINCKVPWHTGLSCNAYQVHHPRVRPDDAKLQALARSRLWRQCIKCKQMIELVEGCYHMTCRCGYEFCYTCGAPWIGKKATCTCPLWEERFIVRQNDLPNQNNIQELHNLLDQINRDFMRNQNIQNRNFAPNQNNQDRNFAPNRNNQDRNFVRYQNNNQDRNFARNQNNRYEDPDDDDDDYYSDDDDYYW